MSVQLLQGDCLELMRAMPDASVDAVITDPPYGTTACAWDAAIPFAPMWEQVKRVVKPKGAVLLFGSQPFTAMLIASNLSWFKYCWVWEKEQGTGFGFAKYQPLRVTEDICVFCEGAHTYNPQMTKRDKPFTRYLPLKKANTDSVHNLASAGHDKTYKTYNEKQPVNLLCYARDYPRLHPTQKPIALLEYLVRTYTNEGETVLDFTMGSGTAGVATQNLKRNFIGIELDTGYYTTAMTRIEAAQQQSTFALEAVPA